MHRFHDQSQRSSRQKALPSPPSSVFTWASFGGSPAYAQCASASSHRWSVRLISQCECSQRVTITGTPELSVCQSTWKALCVGVMTRTVSPMFQLLSRLSPSCLSSSLLFLFIVCFFSIPGLYSLFFFSLPFSFIFPQIPVPFAEF